ncbi:MAG: hypothetical protein V1816_01650 [Pseudomonadota bacterium]
MEEVKPIQFFDLNGLAAESLFAELDQVWQALDLIKDFIQAAIKPNVRELRARGEVTSQTQVLWRGQVFSDDLEIKAGDPAKGQFEVRRRGELLEGAAVVYSGVALMDDRIELGPGVVVEPGALIKGPTIIGERTEVRQGAYLRGSCLVGRRCVVGHATEMKNSIILDGAKAGHFAYLGDSILGREVNLGAGTKLANLKIVPLPIRIKVKDVFLEVDRRKFGAILGDHTETGCNSVTSPGTVMGPLCLVAPNMTVPSGYHPRGTAIRPKRTRAPNIPPRALNR